VIVLVTGGAGFIGRHLVARLLARPEVTQVRVLDNLFRPCPAPGDMLDDPLVCDRRVRFVKGDIRDAQACRQAVAGAELVFHLAAQSNVLGSVTDLGYSFGANVAGTVNLLTAARDAACVRCLVFASSREVYGEPAELPVREHRAPGAQERLRRQQGGGRGLLRVLCGQGLNVRVVRMANVYGTRRPGAGDTRVLPAGPGRGAAFSLRRRPAHRLVPVGLTCEALLRLAERAVDLPAGPVNIGSGKGVSLPELAGRVAACLPERRVETRVLPARGPEVLRFVAHTGRMAEWLGISPPEDPLVQLPETLDSFREARP
jgi:UDP-glucose 4-epimerase